MREVSEGAESWRRADSEAKNPILTLAENETMYGKCSGGDQMSPKIVSDVVSRSCQGSAEPWLERFVKEGTGPTAACSTLRTAPKTERTICYTCSGAANNRRSPGAAYEDQDSDDKNPPNNATQQRDLGRWPSRRSLQFLPHHTEVLCHTAGFGWRLGCVVCVTPRPTRSRACRSLPSQKDAYCSSPDQFRLLILVQRAPTSFALATTAEVHRRGGSTR